MDRALNMRWALFCLVVVVGVALVWQYGPLEQPIVKDRAYLVYMAQALARGENIYQTTTLGYPPAAIGLSAASMRAGRVFEMPFYLPPRIVSLIITGLTGGFLFLFSVRALKSMWLALLSVTILFSNQLFLILAASNLEPKLLALFLAVLLLWQTQRRGWFWCGALGVLAGLCWQPAGIVLMPPFVLLAHGIYTKRYSVRHLGRFVLGASLVGGALFLYLFFTGQLADFISFAIFFKVRSKPYLQEPFVVRFFGSILLTLRLQGIPFILLGAVGFARFLLDLKVPSDQRFYGGFFDEHQAGLGLHTFGWLGYQFFTSMTTAELHGMDDFIPFMFIFCYWAAFGLSVLIRSRCKKQMAYKPRHQTHNWIYAIGALILFVGIMWQAWRYEIAISLDDEIELLSQITEYQNEFETTLAINLPELYVFSEDASPWLTLYVNPYFIDVIASKNNSSCQNLILDIQKRQYGLIVIQQLGVESPCLDEIRNQLLSEYRSQSIESASLEVEPGCGTTKAFQKVTAEAIPEFLKHQFPGLAKCVLQKHLTKPVPQTFYGPVTVFYRSTKEPH